MVNTFHEACYGAALLEDARSNCATLEYAGSPSLSEPLMHPGGEEAMQSVLEMTQAKSWTWSQLP